MNRQGEKTGTESIVQNGDGVEHGDYSHSQSRKINFQWGRRESISE